MDELLKTIRDHNTSLAPARDHVAKLYPHMVIVRMYPSPFQEKVDWCVKKFGQRGDWHLINDKIVGDNNAKWDSRFGDPATGTAEIYFMFEGDAVSFKTQFQMDIEQGI